MPFDTLFPENIKKDVIDKNPDLKDALDSTSSRKPTLSNENQNSYSTLFPTSSLDVGKPVYVSPENKIGKVLPDMANPMEVKSFNETRASLFPIAKRLYDPGNKMSNEQVNRYAAMLATYPQEAEKAKQSYQLKYGAKTNQQPLTGQDIMSSFISGDEQKINASLDLRTPEQKMLEETVAYNSDEETKRLMDIKAAADVEALLSKEIQYNKAKKEAAVNDIGPENVSKILSLSDESKKYDTQLQEYSQRLEQDPNLTEEERANLQNYIKQVIPMKKENINKELMKYGNKVESVKKLEEYDKEAWDTFQSNVEFTNLYPALKEKRQEMDKTAKAVKQEREANPATFVANKYMNQIMGSAISMIVPIKSVQSAVGSLEEYYAADEKMGFGEEMGSFGANAIGSVLAFYLVGKIGASTRAASTEKSATAVGKYLTQAMMNPTTYLAATGSFIQGYNDVYERAILNGETPEKASKSARLYGTISGIANAASEGIFDEVAMFKGLTGEGFMKLLKSGKKVGYKETLQSLAKNTGSELTEEYLTAAGETFGKWVTNANSAVEVFDDVLPTAKEGLGILVGTMLATTVLQGATGGFNAKHSALVDLAKTPELSMKGFDNLIELGQGNKDEIEAARKEVMNYTRLAQMIPGASNDQIIRYAQLDSQEEVAQKQLELSKNQPAIAAVHSAAITAIQNQKQDLINETLKEVKADKQTKSIAAANETFVNEIKATQEQQGLNTDTKAAIQLLENSVNRTEASVVQNGLIPTLITEKNNELEQYQNQSRILQDNLLEAKTNGNEQLATEIQADITKNNQAIANTQSVINGLEKVKPEARALSLDDNADTAATDNASNYEDSAIVESKLKDKSFATAEMAMADDNVKELFNSYKQEGMTQQEAKSQIMDLPAFENMPAKELRAINQQIDSIIPAGEKRAKVAKTEAKPDTRKEAPALTEAKEKAKTETVGTQETKVTRDTKPNTISGNEAVNQAKASFTEKGIVNPTVEDIQAFADDLIDRKLISKRDKNRIVSKLKSYYNTASESRALSLDDYEEQLPTNEPTPQEPIAEKVSNNVFDGINDNSEQTQPQEEKPVYLTTDEQATPIDEINAINEAKDGRVPLNNFGTITVDNLINMELRNFLGTNWSNFLKKYNSLISNGKITDTGVAELIDFTLTEALSRLNERFGISIQLSERTADGYFPDTDKAGNAYRVLNQIIDTLTLENTPNSFAEIVLRSARDFVFNKKSIENKIKSAITEIGRSYGLKNYRAIELLGDLQEETEEVAELMEDGDEVLANIIDKNKGDKQTRTAESISKLVHYVFEKKLKSVEDAQDPGLVYAHAIVSELFHINDKDITKTISYIANRLSSQNHKIYDRTTRLLLEATGEVLYKLDDALYNKAANVDGMKQNSYQAAFNMNELKSVFSSRVIPHNSVSLNRAGQLSIYKANQSKIRKELLAEFKRNIALNMSNIISGPKSDVLYKVRQDLKEAYRKGNVKLAQQSMNTILFDLFDNWKITDSIYSMLSDNFNENELSNKALREGITFLLDLTRPGSEVEQQPIFERIIASYMRTNEREFGKFSESRYYSPKLRSNQSAIQKDNRTLSAFDAIKKEAQNRTVDTTKDPLAPENNVVLTSTNRVFGKGERKEVLSKNPLVAIKKIAERLRVGALTEFSVTKSKIIGTRSDNFTAEQLVLAKQAEMLRAVKYGSDIYKAITQITDSPRVYMIDAPRLFKTDNGFFFSTATGYNLELLGESSLLQQEILRVVNKALAKNSALTEGQIANKIPTFYNVIKTDGQPVVRFSQALLTKQAEKEFKSYVLAKIGEYYNPAANENPTKGDLAKNELLKAAMVFFSDESTASAKTKFLNQVVAIEKNPSFELNHGLKAFAQNFANDEMFNIKRPAVSMVPGNNKTGVKDMFEEFVVNEEYNRFYTMQMLRGGQEHYMDKESDMIFVRTKMFDAPGIPVNLDAPFRYVILDKNLYEGKDSIELELKKADGTIQKTSYKPGDGVMFLSEKANVNIASSLGPGVGMVDQYKYAMSTVNENGLPTAHKAMQIVLTKEMAMNSPFLQKMYDYMQENNIDAVLDDSAEKIGTENRLTANWSENFNFPNSQETLDYVHTANYSDIHVQLPVNQPQSSRMSSDPEQKNRQAFLIRTNKNAAVYDKMMNAIANKVQASAYQAALGSAEFNKLVNNYRKADNSVKKENAKKEIISYFKTAKEGRSAAEQTFFDSVIEKIENGYTFEYDDNLLYNLQSSRFSNAVKSRMESLYMSLMTPLAVPNAPKFRIDKSTSEIILPGRFKNAFSKYADKDGVITVTGVKVPYNNAGTQLRAVVKFDNSLDNNGSSVVVPAEFYALSNSDNDGDHLFIYPIHPNPIDLVPTLSKIMEITPATTFENVLSKIQDDMYGFKFTDKAVNKLIDEFLDYQDAITLHSNAELFETDFGNDMQLQQNDVEVFDRVVNKLGFKASQKHTLSSEGQVQRAAELKGANIGAAASSINIYNTFFALTDKIRLQLRGLNQKQVLFSLKNKVFDPAAMESVIALDNAIIDFAQVEKVALEKAQQRYIAEEIDKKSTLSERQKADKKDLFYQQELNKTIESLQAAHYQKDKMAYMNGTSQLLQLYVDTVKKGYMAKIGLNERNLNAFNHLVVRLSLMTDQETAMEKAINFINQPVVKKYFELTSYNTLLKEEYSAKSSNVLQSLKDDLINRIGAENEEHANSGIANMDYITNEYFKNHVKDIDYTEMIDMVSKDSFYGRSQLEAIKMLESLIDINAVLSPLSLNRKKFERIPTSIDGARTFIAEMENSGVLASEREVAEVRKMINEDMPIYDIQQRLARWGKGLRAGSKIDKDNNIVYPTDSYEKIKQFSNAIQSEDFNSEKPTTDVFKKYMAFGLTKEGVRNYLDLLSKIYANDVIVGNKNFLEDDIYLEKAKSFFMNMAYVGDSIAAYNPVNNQAIYKTISSLISSKSKVAFTNAMSRFQDLYNVVVMKNAIGSVITNKILENNKEVAAELNYSLNLILGVFQDNKYFSKNNGFVKYLETQTSENTTAEVLSIEKGLPVYKNQYYMRQGGMFKPVTIDNVQIDNGSKEGFKQIIATDPIRAFEIALADAMTRTQSPINLVFDKEAVRLINSIDGTVYELSEQGGVERQASNVDELMFTKPKTAKEQALQAMAGAAFRTIDAPENVETYDQWVKVISSYLEMNTGNILSPRHRAPETSTIMLSKGGRTDFDVNQLAEIRTGITQLTDLLSNNTSYDNQISKTIRQHLEEKLTKEGLSTDVLNEEILNNPGIWLKYFADQMPYSMSRNLLSILTDDDMSDTDMQKRLIISRMNNQFETVDPVKFSEYAKEVIYNNPTLTAHFPIAALQEITSGTKEAYNLAKNHEYIHSVINEEKEQTNGGIKKNQKTVLFKRIQVGFIQTQSAKGKDIKLPNYKYVQVAEYNSNGDVYKSTSTNGPVVESVNDLVEIIDQLPINTNNLSELMGTVREMIYGYGLATIDTVEVLKDLQRELDTTNYEKNKALSGGVAYFGQEKFINTMINRLQDADLMNIGNSANYKKYNSDQMRNIIAALKTMQNVSKEDNANAFVISDKTYSDVVGKNTRVEHSRYKGRKLVSPKLTADTKRLSPLDIVRNLVVRATGEKSVFRGRTIGEYIKAYNNNETPTNLKGWIDMMQSGINANPFISPLAAMLKDRIGGVEVVAMDGQAFNAKANQVFAGKNSYGGTPMAMFVNNQIVFNKDAMSIDGPEMIIHEALHALTMDAITDDLNSDLRKDLVNIHSEIVKALPGIMNNSANNGMAKAKLKMIVESELTPLEQMEEIISFAFSDTTGALQRVLGSVTVSNKELDSYKGSNEGVWGKIKGFISRLLVKKFGARLNEDSIFEVLSNVMETYNDRFALEQLSVQGTRSKGIVVDGTLFTNARTFIDSLVSKSSYTEYVGNIMANYNITEEEAKYLFKNIGRANALLKAGINHQFQGGKLTNVFNKNILKSFDVEDPSLKRAIETSMDRMYSFMDKHFAAKGETYSQGASNGTTYSTALQMVVENGIVTVSENGAVNINTTGYSFGQTNTMRETAAITTVSGTSATIFGLNKENQAELLKAATEAYLMEQQGYEIGEVRLFTAENGNTPHVKNYVFNMNELRPYVKDILVRHRVEALENNPVIPTTREEFMNGTDTNHSSFYMHKMAKEMLTPEEFGKNIITKPGLTPKVQEKAKELAVSSYKTIYNFIKNGDVRSLSKQDLEGLIGEVQKLALSVNNADINKSIVRGLTDLLLMESENKTLLQNSLAAKESDIKDMRDFTSVITHSLQQVNPQLGISSLTSEITNKMDKNEMLLRTFQEDLYRKSMALAKSKNRLANAFTKTLSEYGVFPDIFNNVFENLYDKSELAVNGLESAAVKPLKTLSQATVELASGAMSKEEYDVLETLIDFNRDNHVYVYGTKGVAHGGLMEEGARISAEEHENAQYYTPYYPSGQSNEISNMKGARKIVASFMYNTFRKNEKLKDVILNNYKLPDGTNVTGTISTIIRSLRNIEYNSKGAIPVTEKTIKYLFDLAAQENKKYKNDNEGTENAQQSMSLPGFIRTKEDTFNSNLFHNYMNFSKEVMKAKTFAETRGIYYGAIAVAEEADKMGIARYLKDDMKVRILGKKYKQSPNSKLGKSVKVVNQATRLARIGLSPVGAAIDLTATTISSMSAMNGVGKESNALWAKVLNSMPPVNYAFALSKLVTYFPTIRRIAIDQGLLHHGDYVFGKKSLTGATKMAMMMPFWISGNMPRLVMLADQLSLADLDILSNDKTLIRNEYSLIKNAITKVEHELGRFKNSTERIYMSNDYYSSLMMFKSWMPDLIWSRFGGEYKVNGITYEGKYRTVAKLLTDKTSNLTPQQKSDALRSAINGSLITLTAIGGMISQGFDWEDDKEGVDDWFERILDQVVPGSPTALMFTFKNVLPSAAYLVDVIDAMMAGYGTLTDNPSSIYKTKGGKYGNKGESKFEGKLIKVLPGAPTWKTMYKDSDLTGSKNTSPYMNYDLNVDVNVDVNINY